MSRRRHTPVQIVRKLREADRLRAEGTELAEVCRHLEVSVQTYQRRRAQSSSPDQRRCAGVRRRRSAASSGEAGLRPLPTDPRRAVQLLPWRQRGRVPVPRSWTARPSRCSAPRRKSRGEHLKPMAKIWGQLRSHQPPTVAV